MVNTARVTRVKSHNDQNVQDFWSSTDYANLKKRQSGLSQQSAQFIITQFNDDMLLTYDREPRRWTGKTTIEATKTVVKKCLEANMADAPLMVLEVLTSYFDFMDIEHHISNHNTLNDAANDACINIQASLDQQASDERIAMAWARVNPLLKAARIDRNSGEALTSLIIVADKLAVIDMANIAIKMAGNDPTTMAAGAYLDAVNAWIERYVFPLYDLSATAESIGEQMGSHGAANDTLAKTMLIGNLRNDETPMDDETRFQVALRLNQMSLKSSKKELAKFAEHYRSALAWQPVMKRALPKPEPKRTLSMAQARKLMRGRKK